jgi:hypothetical protein
MSSEELKRGYDWAYEEFYRWSNILRASSAHESFKHQLKHFSYSAGWKKFERAWDLVIRLKQLSQLRPVLEAVLSPVGQDCRIKAHAREMKYPVKPENPVILSN